MEKLSLFLFAFSLISTLNSSKSIAFAGTNPNSTTEEESLLAFKSRITSDPFNMLARNWSTSDKSPFCSWIGVSCGANNRITKLDLHGWNLEGTIAPHIGNLTFLISLDLSFNSFTGRIPQELSGLRRLKVFNLGANNLTGEIPWELLNLKLEGLYLRMNGFSGSIPVSIFNISTLKELELSDNHFRGQLPRDMGTSLPNLEYLGLASNDLIGTIPNTPYILNNSFTEYGSEGKVSTSCDIYSYGITLLELFTSKKPTDDMFTEEMSLKDWVSEALQENIVSEIAAAGLLNQEDRHFSKKEQCVSSVFDLAMKCLSISPQQRINVIETMVTLKKIKSSFLASTR